jgi:hypothetical protein
MPVEKSALIGTWRRLSTSPLLPDGSIVRSENEWLMIKVITGSRFLFAEQDPARAKLKADHSPRDFLQAATGFFGGAGTYTFDGETYTERIEIFLNPNYVGISIPYKCEFRGGLWIQSGVFPVASVGLEGPNYDLCEIWERLE